MKNLSKIAQEIVNTNKIASQFIVHVKHDKGVIKIKTTAKDEETAKEIIMKSEGCPERSIIKIVKANKIATDVSEIDPKIGNRIKQMKIIYQDMKKVETQIADKVGELQKQLKSLEKQSTIFEKELMPVLKELQDHAIQAEGIFIELKTGRRSPKAGYEFLASKVNSELLKMAEDVIAKAAEFAQSPSISLASSNKMIKKAGLLDWLMSKWNKFTTWISGLKKSVSLIGKDLMDLDNMTQFDSEGFSTKVMSSITYPKFDATEHQYLLAAFRAVGGSDSTSVTDMDDKRWKLDGKEISREGKKIKINDKTLQEMNGEAKANYWK